MHLHKKHILLEACFFEPESFYKFLCTECIFDCHPQHRMVKLKNLNEDIAKKYREYRKTMEEEKAKIDIFTENEIMNKKQIEELKKYIIEQIERKTNDFFNTLSNNYLHLKGNNRENYNNLREYEEFFVGNAAPVQKIDLNKLSDICNKIYKGNSSISSSDSSTKSSEMPLSIKNPEKNKELDIKTIKSMINKINQDFAIFVRAQKDKINNYLNNEYLDNINHIFTFSSFEWCNKCYSGYQFFYELENKNTKATKTKSNGTMTILRAKEKLENNYKYDIKCKIGYKNGGDFDIGIGTDKSGESCWLRTKESLCISNTGVMCQDLNMDNSVTIKDNDILDFEINTLEHKQTFRASINNKLICLLDFSLEEVYFMAAIRNCKNDIEVLQYSAIPL